MIWAALLGAAVIALVVFATRSSSRGTALRSLQKDYEKASAEVERLRPFEARFAAAQATITAKAEALEQASSEHDEALEGFEEAVVGDEEIDVAQAPQHFLVLEDAGGGHHHLLEHQPGHRGVPRIDQHGLDDEVELVLDD